MSRVFSRALFLLIVVMSAAAAGFAQPGVKETPQGRPFAVGEVLTYEGKASRIIQGIPIADLTFTLTKAPGSDNFLVKTEAVSKGTLLKLFRYSFLQQYESVIDRDKFDIIKTTKHDVQKDRVRDSVADFDYRDKRVSYTETDPKDPNRPPNRIASDMTGGMNDIVSGIYVLRMLPLAVGRSFDVPVSDSGLVYEIPVRVTARELQKTMLGKIWCWRVEPAIFGPDRFIEQKGQMIIWISDDARRIPVRGRIETEAFKVDVRLRAVINSK